MLDDPEKEHPKFKFLVKNDDDVVILKKTVAVDPEPV